MSRHGQCRCGATLTFRQREGYKTRCSKCGKVVRLQVSESSPAEPDEPPLVEAVGLDAEEALEQEAVEPAIVVEEEEAALFVVAADKSVSPVKVKAVSEPVWAWQWLALAGGLVVWEGILSILAWLWWQ